MNKKNTNKKTGAGVHKTRLDYTDPMLLLDIEGLARDGFDDKQIALILDVSREAFSKNKTKKGPDGSQSLLSEALKRGRRPLNVLVENSMYKRAVGQKVKTTTKTTSVKWLIIDGKAKQFTDELITETETELPGDVNAQKFWLQNRKPDVYNAQATKVDVTTGGEKLPANEAPKIAIIEHVTISDIEIKN